jgi:ammonia channel protein AmtB
MFTLTQNRWKIDDVLGVWPLHGLCGAWGGIAAGIFGHEALGGLGGVSLHERSSPAPRLASRSPWPAVSSSTAR